jgi:hypothetical protein
MEGGSCWKSGGDERVFIPGRESDWQMKTVQAPYPEVAGLQVTLARLSGPALRVPSFS